VPRFESGDAAGGLVVEGIYRGLLERERVKCAERDPRRALAKPDDDSEAGLFLRPRALLIALEAGQDVIVGRRTAELALDFRFRLPWDRAVKSVRVSPDDVVRPTDSEHPWYGRAADDPTNYAAPTANTNPNTLPFNLG
jgi:hypothetical protein